MSEERRKTNKQSTGTVPKVKHRNNAFPVPNDREKSRGLTKNLTGYWQHPQDSSNFIRNSRRNQQNNCFIMDTTLEESTARPVQGESVTFLSNAASSVTSNTSSSTSRRNSSGSTLKCDNVTKYPDKRQIEDKLHQIQEYLKITNSLMTSMKNTDEQPNNEEVEHMEKVLNELRDSEKKLIDILNQMNFVENQEIVIVEQPNNDDEISEHSANLPRKNDVDVNIDNSIQEMDSLREQQLSLMRLQQKAENKLKDARQIQGKLYSAHVGNGINSLANCKEVKNYPEQDYDAAIRELEERTNRLRPCQQQNQNYTENIMARVESLHNQIATMHEANNDREQLIEALDNRDAELRSQHTELQQKLVELHNKKLQVDQLVVQLHTFGEEEEEDVGGQVRKIVTMKDQLKKLKDMLEIVKTTENVMQNTKDSPEAQAAAIDVCLAADAFLDKDISKPKLQARASNDSNMLRYENDTHAQADGQPKQVNMRPAKPRTASFGEKLALHAELKAKKKEFEEIMGKHKTSTSNLNHDFGNDVKSEFSCASNTLNDAWAPLLPPPNHRDDDCIRFSSDDGQEESNDYTDFNDNQNMLSASNWNFSPSNTSKYRSENAPRESLYPDFERVRGHSESRTPDRNVRSGSVATSGYIRDHRQCNSEQDSKSQQVQKQLQLIKSVCDSMLEQQASNNVSNRVRNNLTPSPLYSEPRFASPDPRPTNALNLVNPPPDAHWMPNGSGGDSLNSYQNWLATNSIQTQSFMLNTLNQCCQMLWLQQRELVTLRNTVTTLQDRIEGPVAYSPASGQSAATVNAQRPNPKANHVSTAYSLPNLSNYNGHPPPPPPSNIDPGYVIQNNVQGGGRLLDPAGQNNAPHHQSTAEHDNNAINHHHTAQLPQNHHQMWNGQALNNQVAPGNRANNYWDNFRSYSRQNLLSTKNNDMLPTNNERTNPFVMMSFSKSNSEQDSTSTSQENTPQRRGPFRHCRPSGNFASIPPPDVLNVNHNMAKVNEHLDLSLNHDQNGEVNEGLHFLCNLNSFNDTSSNHSNLSEEQVKDCISNQCRRSNEWNDEITQEDHFPKSKLFDELRENVYKEVASLISANESRPHFLIQLFRDLQMIGSDSLRLKILQSIQMVITHSLMSSQNSKRMSLDSNDQEIPQIQDYGSLQSTVWSKPLKNSSSALENFESSFEIQHAFKGALPFLNEHNEAIIQPGLMTALKQILIDCESFKETVKDTVFQKHFSNVLDEVLNQYCGKKVSDIKIHLLQTLNELLCGELSFIKLIQETSPDNILSDTGIAGSSFIAGNQYEMSNNNPVTAENMQNGDLAEADQSRDVGDDNEEEGAVGGVLEDQQRMAQDSNSLQKACEGLDLTSVLDFPCTVEGLDQVPTRLPTTVKSRSTTPNRDRTSSRMDPETF